MIVEAEIIEEREKDGTIKKEYADTGYLQIPIEAKDFKEFVIKLLGKPEILEGGSYCRFKIDKETIDDFTNIFDQRMYQQNGAKLTSFSCKFYYSDGTARTISTYENFLSFKEGKNIICTGIDVTWIYLIKFPDKDIPEKQEILVKFMTSNKGTFKQGLEIKNKNLIKYEIRHTARTWALDIEMLVQNKIEEIKLKESRCIQYFKKNKINCSFGFGMIFYILISVLGLFNFDKEMNRIILKYSKIIGIEEKLDFISNMFLFAGIDGTGNIVFLYMFLSFIIAIGLSLTIFLFLTLEFESFILINKASKDYMLKIEKKMKRLKIKSMMGFIFSLMTGIISSFIFEMIKRIG